MRPGFKVELVAHEPLVLDPVAFDWGADGKLWVVEMRDYPLGVNGKPAGQSVPHVHFHIVPRSKGVDLKMHSRGMESPDKLKALAEKIRAALE